MYAAAADICGGKKGGWGHNADRLPVAVAPSDAVLLFRRLPETIADVPQAFWPDASPSADFVRQWFATNTATIFAAGEDLPREQDEFFGGLRKVLQGLEVSFWIRWIPRG